MSVQSAILDPLDVHLISSWVAQFFPRIQFPYAAGADVAGVIEGAGEDVTNIRQGDAVIVWKYPIAGGGLSEFAAVPGYACAPFPKSLLASEGSAIPAAGSTAWHAVSRLKENETTLSHAVTGGVGSVAVQFVRKAGVRVVATAPGDGATMSGSLGSHEVVDYRKQSFTEVFKNIDLVIDLVVGGTQARSYLVLKRGGRLVSPTTLPGEEPAKFHGVFASMFYFGRASQLSDVVQAIDRDRIRVLIANAPALGVQRSIGSSKLRQSTWQNRAQSRIAALGGASQAASSTRCIVF